LHKSVDIEADGKDPHLLANLSKIGQVKIGNAAATMKMVCNFKFSFTIS
jgi:hypothetical protein